MLSINIPEEFKKRLPVKFIYENSILPIKLENGILTVAISDKTNTRITDDLKFYTGCNLELVEYPNDIILTKLKENFPFEEKKGNEYSSNKNVNELSTIDFVNHIIAEALKSSASDIHFELYDKIFRIRYRIDGHLREVMNLPVSKSSSIMSRIKIMSELDIAEKRRPQDGKISFTSNNRTIDIRVSTLPTNYGEKIVLRILDKSNLDLNIAKLGMDDEQIEILKTALNNPYGMILVTGPTGSGKTTTLYSALKHIHTVERNIVTIEDPIEYNIDGVNQSSVKPEIGYDFASALRAFLRQDPDIIMVGEIRDYETAEIAMRASLTGHLVFSTLHTNDAISAIIRLIDMGIEPYLVASSLKMIVAQRLVRKLCKCRVKTSENTYEKKGCEECGFWGYKGRTAIFELITIDDSFYDTITKRSSLNTLRAFLKEKGIKCLRDSGIIKVQNGITTYEEVYRETTI
jgi:type IV pilus assembly protein PilB